MKNKNENIVTINYEDEMKQSYIDYAMSVIVQRALPDIRDGLKPVHRRILYAMEELGNFPDKAHKKSARIVGDCMGKFHPHGDSSIYGAMVRMSQDFSLRDPLVDGHGNFGSIDGDGAAAMRYTEARLTPLALEMLQDLGKDVVDFKANFDNTLKEPVVLPSKFPNLLVNGSTGIAVGMVTNIPPHNLGEVMDASIALIDNKELSTKQLMKHIKGPDFPTGGIISNKDDLLQIYETGNGRIKVMAKLEVEDIGKGRKNIVITEIPYTLSGSKTKLVEDLVNLVIDKKLDEATEVRDESSKEGLRIVIEIKRGVDIDNLKNKLFKITKLEDTFPVNLLAIKDSRPDTFSLKGILENYISFTKETNLRKINYDLLRSKDRLEILEGLIKASDVIDLIIEIIRNSKDVATVKNCLVTGETKGIAFKTKKSEKDASKLLFTDKQATAILTMQLQRLVGLEIEKLNKELDEVKERIAYYVNLIENEKEFEKYIKEDFKRIKKKYNSKRKTLIDNVEVEEVIEVVIEEELYALIDKFNYLKVIDSQSYVRVNEETMDEYKNVIKIKNTDNLCVFTSDGNIHQVKMSEIPQSKMRDRGTPIDNLFDVGKSEILEITPLEDLEYKVVFITSTGLVKRVEKEEYETNRKTLIATKIMDDDKLIGVKAIGEEDTEIVLITEDNRKIRFKLDEISIQKRNAKGVTGINLNVGDSVVGFEVSPDTDKNKRRRGAKGVVIED